MGAVMILANLHPRVREVRTQWTRRDLQTQAIERNGIILALLAILLFTQDFIQIDTGMATNADPFCSTVTAKRALWAGIPTATLAGLRQAAPNPGGGAWPDHSCVKPMITLDP